MNRPNCTKTTIDLTLPQFQALSVPKVLKQRNRNEDPNDIWVPNGGKDEIDVKKGIIVPKLVRKSIEPIQKRYQGHGNGLENTLINSKPLIAASITQLNFAKGLDDPLPSGKKFITQGSQKAMFQTTSQFPNGFVIDKVKKTSMMLSPYHGKPDQQTNDQKTKIKL